MVTRPLITRLADLQQDSYQVRARIRGWRERRCAHRNRTTVFFFETEPLFFNYERNACFLPFLFRKCTRNAISEPFAREIHWPACWVPAMPFSVLSQHAKLHLRQAWHIDRCGHIHTVEIKEAQTSVILHDQSKVASF